MWVKFTADHWHEPASHKGHVTVHYRAGETHNVTRACGEEAIAAGTGVRTTVRNRTEAKALKPAED